MENDQTVQKSMKIKNDGSPCLFSISTPACAFFFVEISTVKPWFVSFGAAVFSVAKTVTVCWPCRWASIFSKDFTL